MRYVSCIIVLVAIALMMVPTTANAQSQSLYGQRLQGSGGWLLPVASRLLCSDSAMHVRRGSVPSWDICTPQGSAIYPAAPGRVIYAGCNNSGGYGCWVKLDHGNGITSAYAHMVTGSITVQNGQTVTQDMVIGQVGWTGMTSFGPHIHFVIYKDGAHVDPAQVFSQSAMQFCDKCASPGNAPVAAAGTVQAGGMAQQTVTVTSPGQRILQAVAVAMLSMGGQLVAVIFVVILAALLAFWLANNAVRVVMVCAVVCGAVSVTVAVLFMPTQTVSASQPVAQLPGGDVWEYAHELTIGSEGWKCTNDGAYTAGGITQGTYNAWRRSKGLPTADVCKSLTKEERRAIFYERYWLASGANQLPAALALTYVDHAFNAGVGAAKQGLAVCGLDARCYNNWREQSYRSMRDCSLYCRGWINRVNKFRQLEGIK